MIHTGQPTSGVESCHQNMQQSATIVSTVTVRQYELNTTFLFITSLNS